MKYISKSPTFFEYRVKISNIIKNRFKTSRFSERIEGEKSNGGAVSRFSIYPFTRFIFPPWRLRPTPRPFFDRSRFPEKRVFYTPLDVLVIYGRERCAKMWRNPAIFLYLPFLLFSPTAVFVLQSLKLDDA